MGVILLLYAGGVLLVSLCAMPVVQAETYRWRDAEGGTHFGDSPPPNVQAERLTVHPQPSDLTPEQAKQEVRRLRDVEAARRKADEAKKTQASARTKQNQIKRAAGRERCEQAKWALSALDSGRPVYRDEQGMYRIKRPPVQGDAYTGQRTYLDDNARNAEIDRQQKLIARHCETLPTAADMEQTAEEIRMAETCEKAAAELRDLSQPEARASAEALAASRAFMDANCSR